MPEPVILRGGEVARELRARLKADFAEQSEILGRIGMRVVQIGDDPAASAYTRSIARTFKRVGVGVESVELAADVTPAGLSSTLHTLNQDGDVHGVIVQTPYPPQIQADLVASMLAPEKDVDCTTSARMGALFAGASTFAPATAAAVMRLLDHYDIQLEGKRAVVLGRSNTVGKPLAMLLMQRHATVSVLHSRTRDLEEETRRAEILVVAIGRPKLVRYQHVGRSAVVVDVGTNYVDGDATGDATGNVIGDVDYESVLPSCSAISPVPGGVGPLTNTMLAYNLAELLRESAGD